METATREGEICVSSLGKNNTINTYAAKGRNARHAVIKKRERYLGLLIVAA